MKDLKDYVKRGLFYESAVEDGSDIIFVVDYNGLILYHNKSVTSTLGYKSKSLIGKIFFDFILPNSLEGFKKKFKQSVKRPYVDSIEIQFHSRDGAYKYLELNSINIKHQHSVEGLILDCRDVSQRKKDAEELMRAQKAKELFLANISHEIRTPINGIAGMAALLGQNPAKEEQGRYLNAIKTAANNLTVIINDILDLASVESGKLKFEKIEFNINELLSSMIRIFSAQAQEKGLSLSYHIDPSVAAVFIGDPVRLNQILINLVGNAVKFTQRGSIAIMVSSKKKTAKKCFLQFVVTDTGIGIPKDKINSIFESFSQADASVTRKYGGTGLGLTIVKQLAALQKGSVEVFSESGKGSRFTVCIPFGIGSTEKSPSAKSNEPPAQKPELLSTKVLLVEDNEINRLYAGTILKNSGCQLEIAENGYVALAKIKNQDFDIVLMDVQMPLMDGYEATRAIRAIESEKSKVPIIALTANTSAQDIEKCKAAGMTDFIPKPFTPDDLHRILIKYHSSSKQKKRIGTKKKDGLIDLSYLKKVAGGNDNFLKEMMTTFMESTPDNVQNIRQALIHDHDHHQLAQAIHKVKPSLSMMGLNGSRERAILLEERAENGERSAELKEDIEGFCKEIEKAVDELRMKKLF